MTTEEKTTQKPQNSSPAQGRGGSQTRTERGRGRPGGQQTKRRPPKSEYGRQLEEKQKTRNMYAVSEKQFRSYVREASSKKHMDPKMFLFESLEMRLDSVVFRTGLSGYSRKLARQIVSHGHIMVNGKRVNVPSYHLNVGDEIAIRKPSLETTLFRTALKDRKEEKTVPPSWIAFDYEKGTGGLKGVPDFNESGVVADFTSVIEFYSR